MRAKRYGRPVDGVVAFYPNRALVQIVSAVCHGPAAFVDAKLSDGSYLVSGQAVTGFSNSEEDSINLSSAMPFMLETALQDRGASFTKNPQNWGPKVVESGNDGKLITGQNPASASQIAEAILKKIGH
jgi:putative intracellular protease/amidase